MTAAPNAPTYAQQGVAHFAHLGGMIGGFVFLRYWRGPGAVWQA